MLISRLATLDDADAILDFTQHTVAGLTTIPRTLEAVKTYISASDAFVEGERDANRVLFVAEIEGQIVGISGIIPTLGLERPFYSFKRSRHARLSSQLGVRSEYETLQLTTDFDGYSELASMFLAPSARGRGVARPLSLARLCFIENHRELFSDKLMAEIRGWFDEDGNSPFWDDFASKFIQTDFNVADRLSMSDGRFMVELMPAIPIIADLLSERAKYCISRPHDISGGAMKLLMSAGFELSDLIDIFDGGPAIQCRTKATLIARTARDLADLKTGGSQRLMAFSGRGKAFRAIMAKGDLAAGTIDPVAEYLEGDVRLALAQDRRK